MEQPMLAVSDLMPNDLPAEHGVYGWYCGGELFYIGEAPKRTLRQRILQHLRSTARQSTIRNKLAQVLECQLAGFRRFSQDCEKHIAQVLSRCELRVLSTSQKQTSAAQHALIEALDPPMNDNPGQKPRWRTEEVRRILGPCLAS